jgi:hypothetical protein
MYSQISGKLLALPMMSCFLGSFLVFYPQRSEAQNYSSPLPQVEPTAAVEFYQYEQNLQPTQQAQSHLYSQNFQRYLVIVDTSNSQVLQQVRWVEPEAYIRQYEGRAVIQSGIFNQRINAENRVRELQSYGINNVRIVGFNDAGTSPQPAPSTPASARSSYYVVIPAEARNISVMANDIRNKSGQYNLVLARQQPLGPHVAVGPFPTRGDAERWNQYVRDIGYGNARVYYGR